MYFPFDSNDYWLMFNVQHVIIKVKKGSFFVNFKHSMHFSHLFLPLRNLMINNLSKYFLESSSLDSLSVTDIEGEIEIAPFASSYRMLLAKKMSDFESQQLMLINNDRVWMHYVKHAENRFPSIYDNSFSIISNNNPINSDRHLPEEFENVELIENLSQNSDQDMPVVEKDENLIKEIETISPVSEIEGKVGAELSTLNVSAKNKKKKVKKFKLNEYRGISEFSKWLLSFKKDDIEKQIKKEEKAARKKAFDDNAKKSVTKSSAIISEPLAEILASQGHLDDAKKMYEQLMVKYPEKSSYFAAKIETLIKK